MSFPRSIVGLYSSVFLIIFLAFGNTLEGASPDYRLKIGATYIFEISTSIQSECSTLGEKFPFSQDFKAIASVTVLAFRNGLYVLDLESGDRAFRRYVKPDGTVFLTSGEKANDLPFFITFPKSDWPDGKPYRLSTGISIGKTSIPCSWDVKIEDQDDKGETKNLKISGGIGLPADRAVKRSLDVKGTAVWTRKRGCVESGEIFMDYALSFSNKEVAVIRPIWDYKEKRSIAFQLTEINER